MKVVSVKTDKIKNYDNLFKVLDEAIESLEEKSIVVITSKIVSLAEGRVISNKEAAKEDFIKKEAEFYLEGSRPYGIILTIKDGIIIPNSGIDESNVDGASVLWPKDPQKSANEIRAYLVKRFSLEKVGVIISDSKTTPLRWGTTGVGLAYSGFYPLNDYIGKEDIYGRKMQATKANILDGLAAAAVLVMGEGNEQTPISIISDLEAVRFNSENPTKSELDELKIKQEDDLYAPMLTAVKWDKSSES